MFSEFKVMKITKIISDWFEIDTSDFTEDTLLPEFIKDDVDLSLLIEMVESEFGVLADDSAAESWKVLADVIGFIDGEY
jgi:acyl carrier protein